MGLCGVDVYPESCQDHLRGTNDNDRGLTPIQIIYLDFVPPNLFGAYTIPLRQLPWNDLGALDRHFLDSLDLSLLDAREYAVFQHN